jgi:hypothetical protein
MCPVACQAKSSVGANVRKALAVLDAGESFRAWVLLPPPPDDRLQYRL